MPPPRMSPTMNRSSIFLVSVGLSWLSRFGAAGSDSAWAAMTTAYPWESHVKPAGWPADTDPDHAPRALPPRRLLQPRLRGRRDRRLALRGLAGHAGHAVRRRLR